jgi:NitT/TauT family transport system substrate-binding protein
VIVLVLLAACSPAATAATNVNVQLSWLHNSEFAGFYVAQDKGYYTQANLHVELFPSGYDDKGNFIDPIVQVTTSKADFGIIDGTNLLAARANGTPIVAIATIYQLHPVAFTSLAEKNIVRPQDLVGKKVAVSGISKTIYTALLSSQGIDPTTVQYVERTDFTDKPLVDNEVDVIDAWLTNEVVQLTEEGHAVNNIIASDYGIESYPDVIFTTEDMISKHPDLVEQFLKATVRGLQGALDDPDSAAKLTVTYDPKNLNEQTETDAMQQSLPLINPIDSKPGMMTADTWEYMNKIMTDQGLLTKPLDLSAAYNLTFLQKIYGDKPAA